MLPPGFESIANDLLVHFRTLLLADADRVLMPDPSALARIDPGSP